MGETGPPAWPFLLGAIVSVALGFWQVAQGSVFGWVFVAGALLLFAIAMRQGRRAMAASPSTEPEPAKQPVTTTQSGALSAYYENEDAVRAMQKESRRLCKTCGSPVLEKASECPTCGSSV